MVKMNSFDMLFNRHYHKFFLLFFVFLVTGIGVFGTYQILSLFIRSSGDNARDMLEGPSKWEEVVVGQLKEPMKVIPTQPNCHYFNCFNVYKCGRSGRQHISVYVYPLSKYVDEDLVEIKPMSKEFYDYIHTIVNSKYYTSDPSQACLFIPTVDLLNENNLRKDKIAEILTSLKHWNKGENHVLMNMLPGTPPEYLASFGVDHGRAMVAGGGFSSLTYRRNFDISIPIYNPLHQDVLPNDAPITQRKYFIISPQVNIHRQYREDLENQALGASSLFDLLVLHQCLDNNITKRCYGNKQFLYPQILSEGQFCLVIRGGRLGQTALYDAMRAGCVPVIVSDGYVLPFSEVLDWSKASIQIYEDDIPDILSILKRDVSAERLIEMQKMVIWFYKEYFASMKEITLTTLRILNDRVFPVHSKTWQQWNNRPVQEATNNPLFLPTMAPKSEGFTAVILTYDRLDSLIQVITNLAEVESLTKIVVVWNNQKISPPPESHWLKVKVPVKVVQTEENKLSNRFYPYEEITTECILALDDDINMMTPDELEFGYQVWREFPDRIVGFPSRNVVWNNETKAWRYDSEWTNEVSMVLTGVAFYHKYWSYVYTTQMPGDIKDWVDDHFNCEDIAMNFLVANLTGKAPIKVTPRKKFKCGECTSSNLSATEAHMVERSQCVNYFTKLFGNMPLKTVEFRADPVLFMDNLPEHLKFYNNMGSL